MLGIKEITVAAFALAAVMGAARAAEPAEGDIRKNIVHGSSAKFQKAILQAPCTLASGKLEYTGPNSATIKFFLTDDPYVLPKIDGKTLDLDLEYNYKSPFMEGKVGSDTVTVRYGSRRWEYDFGRNTVTEFRE